MRLQRHEHLIGQRQGVEREQPKTRRAVDQHDVVEVFNRGELPRKDLLTIRPTGQLNLGSGQIDLRGNHVQVLGSGDQTVRRWTVRIDEQIVHGVLGLLSVDAKMQGQVSLRIQINQADAAPGLGDRRAEIHGRRRLADASLLVHQRDGARAMSGGACGVGHSDQYIDRRIRSRP